jgi:hypothetical protein
MNPLCKIFESSSGYIKDWLQDQPELKEESITDWFLYNLSKWTPTIRYKQFTRTEEGRKTGADWEWWFVFSDKESFALRVQAKKLKPNKDNYSSIAYVSGDKLQIERLLDDSAKDGFASFYAFYSTESPESAKCKGFNLKSGVFIGEANILRSEFILKGKKKIEPKDIMKFSNPISCLFCCPNVFETGDFAEEFRQHIKNNFPTISDNLQSNNITQDGFRETPQYILSLINEPSIPEWWEQQMRSSIERVNAIVVVDLRREELKNDKRWKICVPYRRQFQNLD